MLFSNRAKSAPTVVEAPSSAFDVATLVAVLAAVAGRRDLPESERLPPMVRETIRALDATVPRVIIRC